MPYVSIVLPTMRVGGLDVVCCGLEQQSFKDFELVVSDGLYKYRREEVAEIQRLYNFPIVHTEPINNPFPLNSFCRYANTALAHASGEVILFITDYTWLPIDTVKVHADFHRSNGPNSGLMCPHQYRSLPELKPGFPTYAKDQIDQYVLDIESGKLDSCKWSIFIQLFSGYENLPIDPVMGNADPKLSQPTGGILASYFHAKNESCKLQPVIDINGWDEDLDGAHCYQDSDIADRLTTKAGIQWTCNPSNVVDIINPRHIFPFPRRLRSIESNKAVWDTKKGAGYPPVNNWNIDKTRQHILAK